MTIIGHTMSNWLYKIKHWRGGGGDGGKLRNGGYAHLKFSVAHGHDSWYNKLSDM